MLTLIVLPDVLAIARLEPVATVPPWAAGDGFLSITRNTDELSIVCRQDRVPQDVRAERGWRVLKLDGPFDLSQVGILKQVLDPLAEAKVGIFAISTFDTDYVLVKAAQFEQAITALTRFGHTVRTPPAETIDISCSWRLPDGSRIGAVYRTEVMEYQSAQDRWLVRILGARVADGADAETRGLIEGQVGKWVFVPSEARRGLTLPLKYETLTGRVRWFQTDDPRFHGNRAH